MGKIKKSSEFEEVIPIVIGGALVTALAVQFLRKNVHSFATGDGSSSGSSGTGGHPQQHHHTSSHPSTQHHTTTSHPSSTQHHTTTPTHHTTTPTHHTTPIQHHTPPAHHHTTTTPIHHTTPASSSGDTGTGLGFHHALGFGGGGGGHGGGGFGGGGHGGGFGGHGGQGGGDNFQHGGQGGGHFGGGDGFGDGGGGHGGHGGHDGSGGSGSGHTGSHTGDHHKGHTVQGAGAGTGGTAGGGMTGSSSPTSTHHGGKHHGHGGGGGGGGLKGSASNDTPIANKIYTKGTGSKDKSGTFQQHVDGNPIITNPGNDTKPKPTTDPKTLTNAPHKVDRLFPSTGKSVDGSGFGVDGEKNPWPSNRFVGYVGNMRNLEGTAYTTVGKPANDKAYTMVETGGPHQSNTKGEHNCCNYSIGIRANGDVYAKEESDHSTRKGGDDGDLHPRPGDIIKGTRPIKEGETIGLKSVLLRDLKDANGKQKTRLIGYIDRDNNGKWSKFLDMTNPYGVSQNTGKSFPVITDIGQPTNEGQTGTKDQEFRARTENMGKNTTQYPGYTEVHEVDVTKLNANGDPIGGAGGGPHHFQQGYLQHHGHTIGGQRVPTSTTGGPGGGGDTGQSSSPQPTHGIRDLSGFEVAGRVGSGILTGADPHQTQQQLRRSQTDIFGAPVGRQTRQHGGGIHNNTHQDFPGGGGFDDIGVGGSGGPHPQAISSRDHHAITHALDQFIGDQEAQGGYRGGGGGRGTERQSISHLLNEAVRNNDYGGGPGNTMGSQGFGPSPLAHLPPGSNTHPNTISGVNDGGDRTMNELHPGRYSLGVTDYWNQIRNDLGYDQGMMASFAEANLATATATAPATVATTPKQDTITNVITAGLLLGLPLAMLLVFL